MKALVDTHFPDAYDIRVVLDDLNTHTPASVYEAFPPERAVDFSTVQTYLRRLDAKGYVRAWLEGRTRVYAPLVKPTTVIRETVDDLVDRLFGGRALPLVRHLIERHDIDEGDLAELRELLDRLEGQSDA